MGKRILVVTMDCWSKYNSATTADTFEKILTNHNSMDIASLYLNEEIPSSDRCSKFYSISENKIIKSVIKRNISTGTKYDSDCYFQTEENEKNFQKTKARNVKYGKKRRYVFLWIREFLWRCGKWKTAEFDAFLDEFKPEVILFGMEGYRYFNRINRYVIKRTGAKAYGFFWDDNFTYKQRKKTFGFLINRTLQKRSLKKTVKLCSDFFAISKKTKEEADETFKINCKILTKPIEEKDLVFDRDYLNRKIKLVYTGNLKIGRFDTLKVFSQLFNENKTLADRFVCDVYSSTEIEKSELESLHPSIQFKGSIPKDEVVKVQQEADVLVLLEDIVGDNRLIARLSFSTKVTDYLSMGKPILAIADNSTATIEYLQEENCAICAGNKKEIEESLNKILEDPNKLNEYAKRAYETGKKNHSLEKVEKVFYDTIKG